MVIVVVLRHLLLFSIKNLCCRNAPRHVVNVEHIHSRSAVRPELENESIERVRVTVESFQHGHLSTSREVLIETNGVGWPLQYIAENKSQLPQTDPRDALYTKMDAQCDKLATDDRRQFITLSVHLS